MKLELDKTFYHAFHIMNIHLVDNAYEAAQLLSELADGEIASFKVLLSAVAFGGVALLLAGFAVFMLNLHKIDVAFAGALQLLRRLPPLAVVGNAPLLAYLLKKAPDKEEGKMTV
jgi:hypothetical protein